MTCVDRVLNTGKRWLIVCLLMLSNSVIAHENRPLYVDISELDTSVYRVQTKVPPSVAIDNQPRVIMPEVCRATVPGRYQCADSLAGQSIVIQYAQYNPLVSSFVRLTRQNGEIYSALLTAEEKHWQIPAEESTTGVARQYTWLGIEHILIGLDHLLFLACLLFVARGLKRVVITVTGFTLAHSITLIASAMQWVTVPIAPVETLIAFSILFLAVEIARKQLGIGQQNSLTFQYPVLVSASFGLLHGFGFAAVLRDIGLPQTELITGLLFFNIGVELGQLLFTLFCFGVVWCLKHLAPQLISRQGAALATIYCVGILSAYWVIDRGVAVF